MIDRITVSVIQHRLEAIVQEMGEAMLRTAYSQILNSSRDFSTAVFDGEGRLAAQAEHVPIHVGAHLRRLKALRERVTQQSGRVPTVAELARDAGMARRRLLNKSFDSALPVGACLALAQDGFDSPF